jgi:preprotein translocase subunit SecA
MGFVEDFMTGRDDETRRVANEKYIAELQERVKRINELESTVEELGDEEMVAKTMEFRERLKKGEDINGKILEEAFAVVREAAW